MVSHASVGSTSRGSGQLQRVELRDAVTHELRELILDGEFPAGSRLVETDLAERFGTSRGPVRDALAALERVGLVQTLPRRGSFVTRLTATDIAELYELRMALETTAIAAAITTADADAHAELAELLDELEATLAGDDARASGEADMHFHRRIVELAGNSRLLRAWNRIADQTVLLMRDLSHVRPDIQGPSGDHRTILSAFTSGDIDLGRQAVIDHLRDACEILTQRFMADDPDQRGS